MSKHVRWAELSNLCASGAMVIASGFLIWAAVRTPDVGQASVQMPDKPISLAGLQTRGAQAKVALIEYVDVECPFCRKFATDVFPYLDTHYFSAGKAVFAVSHLPLTVLHPLALKAAAAAECAAGQGKFWPMYDRLLNASRPLDEVFLGIQADELELDLVTFRSCLSQPMFDRIDRDIARAKALGIESTPTFFVGLLDDANNVHVRKIIRGSRSIGEFKEALDSLVGTVEATKPSR